MNVLLKQIILITDGCSNTGLNPVVAAAHAANSGITVNVIGIVDEGEIGRDGASEAEAIAQGGGGMCRIVQLRDLSQTVQMMTRKTVAETIRGVVEKELKKTFAVDSVEQLSPVNRAHVVKVMDDLGEQANLRVCLLIDTSASMKTKLASIEDAVHDLSLSLEARAGKSEISVMKYPADSSEAADIVLQWTDTPSRIKQIFGNLAMRGVTPTGPAIMSAMQYVAEGKVKGQLDHKKRAEADEQVQETGLLQDYVV